MDDRDFITESRSRDSPVRCVPLTLNACKYSVGSLYYSMQYSFIDHNQLFMMKCRRKRKREVMSGGEGGRRRVFVPRPVL